MKSGVQFCPIIDTWHQVLKQAHGMFAQPNHSQNIEMRALARSNYIQINLVLKTFTSKVPAREDEGKSIFCLIAMVNYDKSLLKASGLHWTGFGILDKMKEFWCVCCNVGMLYCICIASHLFTITLAMKARDNLRRYFLMQIWLASFLLGWLDASQ